MNDHNGGVKARKKNVKRPIRETLLLTGLAFFIILSILVVILADLVFSSMLYSQYDSKLEEVTTYVENNADVDGLKACLEELRSSDVYAEYTERTAELVKKRAEAESEEEIDEIYARADEVTEELLRNYPHQQLYDDYQLFLNGIVDDLGLEYLYIVIPQPEIGLVNLISATSAAEFEAGADNLPLGSISILYSQEELTRYQSFWNTEEMNTFEESSDWGTFYTGVKTLRDSSGETVALVCIDLSISDLHSSLTRLVVLSLLVILLLFIGFAAVSAIRVRRNITQPLYALERSATAFAVRSKGSKDIAALKYDKPDLKVENEIRLLGDAVAGMVSDMREYVAESVVAEMRAERAENENRRLAEEAAANEKIAELTKSLNTLLNNMPALTFYKDVKTGVYLACNLAFARYAGKESEREVIGLTDRQLFDPATAEHFESDDHKAFNMDRPYSFIEDVSDAEGNPKRFQTTKQKFTDPDGRLCLLGMCVDVTDVMQSEKETARAMEAYEEARSASLTYAGIASALSSDYVNIFYVNIDNEQFIEYSSDVAKEDLVVERRGEDFFNAARRDAKTLLYADDVELFLNTFTRKNVLDKIDNLGTFTLTYRTKYGTGENDYTYVNMKASRLDDVHIIIGVNSVDEQMKYQEELARVQEERTTYSRVTALSGEYLVIYTVDPVTFEFSEYSATDQFKVFEIAKSGSNFFEESRKQGETAVCPEDLEMYLDAFTVENVMADIEKNGMFSLTYRLMIAGSPTYIELKAAKVVEKNGPQLIVGVLNVDARVRREQAYAYDLSVARSQANIDALTGVKNKHAYVDFEQHLDRLIYEKDPPEFAIAVFDVNGLKQVNDTQGHRAGDELICSACAMICGVFEHSPVFRIGGDEFVAVAQGSDYENVELLEKKITEINLEHIKDGKAVVACGVAMFAGDRNVAAVFERADVKMYNNKKWLKKQGME